MSFNPYAFPTVKGDLGMSLRDYFAAHVDVSPYFPHETFKKANGRYPTIVELAQYISEIRAVEADALLARLEK